MGGRVHLGWILLLVCNCSLIVEDRGRPAAPVWVGKSLPASPRERGIDADNTIQPRIKLEWFRGTDPDLAGYRIYRADSLRGSDYLELVKVGLTGQNPDGDTLFYDSEVAIGIPYYYYIRSLDQSGNISPPSDTISYSLLLSPVGLSPVNMTVTDRFNFEWIDFYHYTNEYVIRLEDVTDSDHIETVWVSYFLNTDYGHVEKSYPLWQVGILGNFTGCDSLKSGNSYRWKVKAIEQIDGTTGVDISSGESQWSSFTVR